MKYNHSKNFTTESFLMKFAIKLGLKKLRWSFRRLHCPVDQEALVLEVGAGGNPYPRANVLLDAMESTVERNEQNLITDRPLILGLCEKLPFKNKSFDFIIASHVLEHTDNPEKFLSELMRVGKAGYIETPEGWFEKLCAFTFHRLEVSDLNGKLFIRKKSSWKPDESALLWDNKLSNSKALLNFLQLNPDLYHMRFYWNNQIDYEIINPDCNASWPFPSHESNYINKESLFHKIRNFYLDKRRWLFSQNSRNKNLNIFNLLMCPNCDSEVLLQTENEIICQKCNTHYEVKNNIPRLFPNDLSEFNAAHTN
jgi:uncharacterized protein YbaR (Trm112 family)